MHQITSASSNPSPIFFLGVPSAISCLVHKIEYMWTLQKKINWKLGVRGAFTLTLPWVSPSSQLRSVPNP